MKRDSEYMISVLGEVMRLWLEFPEYRLCQLLVNVTQSPDTFYTEDEKLLTNLIKFEKMLSGARSWRQEGYKTDG